MPGSLLCRSAPVPGISVPHCCVTRCCSGVSLAIAAGSLANVLMRWASCRKRWQIIRPREGCRYCTMVSISAFASEPVRAPSPDRPAMQAGPLIEGDETDISLHALQRVAVLFEHDAEFAVPGQAAVGTRPLAPDRPGAVERKSVLGPCVGLRVQPQDKAAAVVVADELRQRIHVEGRRPAADGIVHENDGAGCADRPGGYESAT